MRQSEGVKKLTAGFDKEKGHEDERVRRDKVLDVTRTVKQGNAAQKTGRTEAKLAKATQLLICIKYEQIIGDQAASRRQQASAQRVYHLKNSRCLERGVCRYRHGATHQPVQNSPRSGGFTSLTE